MALICTISQEVPQEPVISPRSGHVFEKRLIEKYIAENGTDPISGEELTHEDLIQIKTSEVVKPRPVTATSIPSILKLLQDEWDACMLHNFTMRQQLHTARKELSHALYQHDAACRVIARLNKEVTAAREALATLKPAGAVSAPVQLGTAATQQPQVQQMDTEQSEVPEEDGMSEEVLKKLQDRAAVLTSARKQRGKTVPPNLVKSDDIKEYRQVAQHTGLHSAGQPGITAIDIQSSDSRMILTGGMDKSAVVFNKETEKVVAELKGHQKKITAAIYHPSEPLCVTGSADSTIRVWNISESEQSSEQQPQHHAKHILRAHTDAITGVSLHATGDYVLSVSLDTKWAFSDIRSGRILCKINDDSKVSQAMTCAQFHPDGLIFGVGTQDAMVKIWDLKEQSNVANFPGHEGPIQSISFSENGFYLATAAATHVKLWDLRKLRNFRTIELEVGCEPNDVRFDESGTYLAVAGKDVRVYLCKAWHELARLSEHTAPATGVRFGQNASFIASVGMDRSLRFYSMSSDKE